MSGACVLLVLGVLGTTRASVGPDEGIDRYNVVGAPGDTDGDGVGDIVLVGIDREYPDEVYLVLISGETGETLRSRELLRHGDPRHSLAITGDLDGDRVGDVVTGDPLWGPDGSEVGRIRVLSGDDFSELGELQGTQSFGWLGRTVAGIRTEGDWVPSRAHCLFTTCDTSLVDPYRSGVSLVDFGSDAVLSHASGVGPGTERNWVTLDGLANTTGLWFASGDPYWGSGVELPRLELGGGIVRWFGYRRGAVAVFRGSGGLQTGPEGIGRTACLLEDIDHDSIPECLVTGMIGPDGDPASRRRLQCIGSKDQAPLWSFEWDALPAYETRAWLQSIPDFDGDGTDDLVVGCSTGSPFPGSPTTGGALWLLSGRGGKAVMSLAGESGECLGRSGVVVQRSDSFRIVASGSATINTYKDDPYASDVLVAFDDGVRAWSIQRIPLSGN